MAHENSKQRAGAAGAAVVVVGNAEEVTRDLDRVLADLALQYQRLGALVSVKMGAMRKADTKALGACITQENGVVQEIAEIEKRRIRIVGELAKSLGSKEGVGTRISWIAEFLGRAGRERLAVRAQALRELMEGVRKENEVAAIVAERLARHMEGLWAQVVATLNHSRTYGRKGAVQPGPRVVSALDLTS